MHTQGPWIVEGRTVYALNEKGVNRFYASVQDAHTNEDELKDNARLIAAAPELLEALEKIVELAKTGAPLHSIGPGYFENIQQVATAAIKKAKDGR